jgi:hypothetical protein
MTTTTSQPAPRVLSARRSWIWSRWVLRFAALAALATSGYIHLNLASRYSFGPAITQGQLFIIQGVVAILIGLWLVIRDSWPSWVAAALLMASSCAAVVISTVHQIPAIGPLPSLYEPVWYTEKTISAFVEGAFVLLVLARFALRRRGTPTG